MLSMLKKITALFLLSAMIFTVAACSGEPSEENVPEYGQFDNTLTPDFGGETYLIGQDLNYPDYFLHVTYLDNTLYCDYAKKHVAEAEEKLNCNLDIVSLGKNYEESAQNLVLKSVGGVYSCDVYFADSAGIIIAALGGALAPVDTDSNVIDLSDTEKYGTANMLEKMVFNSVPYAVIPAYWPSITPGVFSFIATNNELLLKKNIEDIYEVIEAGIWTWDYLEDLTRRATIIEGDTHIYGLAGDLIILSIINNGVRLVYRDGDVYKTDLDSAKTIEAIAWSQHMIDDMSDYYVTGDAYGRLTNGETAMGLLSNWTTVNDLAYVIEDFSVFPFPTGPSAEKYDDWHTYLTSHYGLGISPHSRDTFAAAHIISELLEPFEEFPDIQSLKDYYTRNIFHDSRDSDFVWNAQNNCTYFYNWVGGNKFFDAVTRGIHKQTPAELVESNISLFQEVMDEYMVPNAEFMATHD